MNKVIFWKKEDGSIARESVAYAPNKLMDAPAVFHSEGDVLSPAIHAEGGEIKTAGYIDEDGKIVPMVRYKAGEVMMPSVLATGKEVKTPATYRDETEDEVFDRWLAYRKSSPPPGYEFAGVVATEDDIPPHLEKHFDHHEWDDVAKKPVLNREKLKKTQQ